MVVLLAHNVARGQGFEMLAAIIGSLLWVVAYVLMVIRGFRDQTYGLPLVAITLNFTWEFIYVFVYPPDNNPELWLRILWLVADVFNVFLLIRYGRAVQSIPQIRRHFYSVLVWTFALCYVGHLALHHRLGTNADDESAYSINFIMSILFVFMFFNRQPTLSGISYGAAWAKMLGTGLMSLAALLSFLHSGKTHYLLLYLSAGVFLFDVLYIYLVREALHGPEWSSRAATPA
jgi:hypothetical protein